MQVINILTGTSMLILGFVVIRLNRGFPDESEKTCRYSGKITEVSPESVTVRYQYEDEELEHEFLKIQLPQTSYRQSLKAGMPVWVFQADRRSQPLVTAVGERSRKKDGWLAAAILFAAAMLFFTGNV